ncbi:MAG: hypothetical protein QW690_00325, partial [Candidatus Anstonellales archaeon]
MVLSSAQWDVLVMWNKTFHGGYGWDRGYSITKSDDGGYVIVGWSYQGTNYSDFWIIKFYEYIYDVRGNFSSNVSNNDYWINLTLDSAISWNVTLVVDGVDVNSSVGS